MTRQILYLIILGLSEYKKHLDALQKDYEASMAIIQELIQLRTRMMDTLTVNVPKVKK